MRLLPSEEDRLLVFTAAEFARRRLSKGGRLSQAEAVALLADEVMEAARDGLPYADVERTGYARLGTDDVFDGVAELIDRVEIEALFPDGNRLIVLHDPIARDGPPTKAPDRPVPWLAATASIAATNESDIPIALSSRFHVFEANRRVRFDRRVAWGMTLAVEPGIKVTIEPGETLELRLQPIGGRRVVRGHGELVDGPLDEPGALERALDRAAELGYLDG